METEVVVVGGGPAGMTGALVLARARRRVVLVDDRTYRNVQVREFHGFPGRDATDPASFRRDARTELEGYGVDLVDEAVVSVRRGVNLELGLASGTSVRARVALVATGVRDVLPAIEGLSDRWGRSVFNCPFCDGWEHRDQSIVVIDGGPGTEHLVAMLRSWTADIAVVPAGMIRRLVGDGTELEAVELHDGTLFRASAVFLRAPTEPRSDIARHLGCRLDDAGFILTDETGRTSQLDVWAAGDVGRPPPRPHQVVLAAADGSAAGIAIHKHLLDETTAGPQ